MDDLDAKWGDFMASSGVQLEEDILQSLQESRHILDIEDGTHASWYDSRLGTLLVFQHEEALSMIGAWHDADGGDLIALSRVLRWVSGFMDMLEQCLMLYDSFDDE
mgnify:FL=1|jgi:hypothetical protein